MAGSYDVVIVGAAIWGCGRRTGWRSAGCGRIAVCERQWAGFGATTRSAGRGAAAGRLGDGDQAGEWAAELYLSTRSGAGPRQRLHPRRLLLPAESEEQAAIPGASGVAPELWRPNDWLDADEGRRRFRRSVGKDS